MIDKRKKWQANKTTKVTKEMPKEATAAPLQDVSGDHELRKRPAGTESENSSGFEMESPSTLDGAMSSTTAQDEPLCEGDTHIITNLLPPTIAEDIFTKVRDEVQWQKMSHQGGEVPRLVAVQGEIDNDGSIPIYRHPADESPPLSAFSPAVRIIRKEVEIAVGHDVNHCLIQFYRGGKDYISEHTDKTLDIVPGTFIGNVSLGAERTMVFRGKRDARDGKSSWEGKQVQNAPRDTIRARLPHNSLCRMGLRTNMRWMHSIRQDKRLEREKTREELDFGGMRISLTFRLIGTFLSKDQTKIWGQGAVAKHKADARLVLNGVTDESRKMIEAFGAENRASEFDGDEVYGCGFDVLHILSTRKLMLSGNPAVNMGVMAMLGYLGVEWTPSTSSSPVDVERSDVDTPLIKLVDKDASRSTIEGHTAILLYLDAVYSKSTLRRTPVARAKFCSRLTAATALSKADIEQTTLNEWESRAAEDEYIAGSEVGAADFALWPVLHHNLNQLNVGRFPRLHAYCKRLLELDAIKNVLTSMEVENNL